MTEEAHLPWEWTVRRIPDIELVRERCARAEAVAGRRRRKRAREQRAALDREAAIARFEQERRVEIREAVRLATETRFGHVDDGSSRGYRMAVGGGADAASESRWEVERFASRERRLVAIGVRTGVGAMRRTCARLFGQGSVDSTPLRLDDPTWRADPSWRYDDGG